MFLISHTSKHFNVKAQVYELLESDYCASNNSYGWMGNDVLVWMYELLES